VGQPGAVEQAGQRGAQRFRRPGDLGGRELLGADLQQRRLRGADLAEPGRPGRGERGRGDAQGVPELGAAVGPEPGNLLGQGAHPAERRRPLGRGDRAARVEHVEGV